MLRAFPWVAGAGGLLWPSRAKAAVTLDTNDPSANGFRPDGTEPIPESWPSAVRTVRQMNLAV
jgi:hypothetical protein